MSYKFSAQKIAMAFLALLIFVLAACSPAPTPQTGAEQPTQPVAESPESPVPASPTPATPAVFPGLQADDILIQLDYEPGFTLPEYRFAFGRVPNFTLLADGRVIYMDENKDFQIMIAQLSMEEATALLDQVRELGFERLESHTDMCGKLVDGTENCIADASTTVMRVRMADGSLREIKNYANFANEPATYDAIYNLMNEYESAQAALYVPHGATLFVRSAEMPTDVTPAEWPLDPAYIELTRFGEMGAAFALSAEEAAKWQQAVGTNNGPIVLQHNGQPISAFYVPWLPGVDYTEDIAREFKVQ